jgi:hypothetical protein
MAEGFADRIEELLPAYALNALDERERLLVERALESDPRYWTKLEGYLEAVAAIAPSEPAEAAPPGVRTRVLRAVWAPPKEAEGMATRVRPRIPIAFLGIAAAWLFALIGLGAVETMNAQRVRDLKEDLDTLAAENQRQEERLRSQAELTTFAVQPGVSQASMVAEREPDPPKQPPMGYVYTSTDGKQVLWAMNLDPAQEGFVYRVWLSEGTGETYPMATFTVGEDGQAFVPMWLSDQHQGPLWITVHLEPASAGATPLGDRILWGRLR